ncbi:unnamed protein product, partial [Discosporangium mesarthrocarpum]
VSLAAVGEGSTNSFSASGLLGGEGEARHSKGVSSAPVQDQFVSPSSQDPSKIAAMVAAGSGETRERRGRDNGGSDSSDGNTRGTNLKGGRETPGEVAQQGVSLSSQPFPCTKEGGDEVDS